MTNIQKIRQSCFEYQHGKCYYCQQSMWHNDAVTFARERNLSEKQARLFRATAEHLKAKSDGGKDSAANIVAACLFCNGQRHKTQPPLTPDKYQRKVRRRIARGKWFPISFVPAQMLIVE